MDFLRKAFGFEKPKAPEPSKNETVIQDALGEHRSEKSPLVGEKEGILAEREIEAIQYLGGGINYAYVLTFKDDGKGVFKPKSGEEASDYSEDILGTYYLRERAAYLVSKFFNLDLVPVTVLRRVEEQPENYGGIGSLQEFIQDPKTPRELSYDEKRELVLKHTDWINTLFAFDFLIFNSDRHHNNLVISNGSIWAIDNGMSMAQIHLRFEPFEDSYLTGQREKGASRRLNRDVAVPQHVVEKLEAIAANPNERDRLKEMLKELIDKNQVVALMKRLDSLLMVLKTHGKIPKNALMEYEGIFVASDH